MANYNKVILAGNMTRDPQLSYLPSNTPVVEFGLATNRKWRGADGQMKEEACFVDCKAFGKPAETINQYMAKGRSLLIEGRLQFRQWVAKDGGKRSKHEVVVEQFQFLDGRRGDQPGAPRPASSSEGTNANETPASRPFNEGSPVATDSDIPF